MVELFEQDERQNNRQSSKGNQLKWKNNGIWYKAAYGRRWCSPYRYHSCTFAFRSFLRGSETESRRKTTEYGWDTGPEA